VSAEQFRFRWSLRGAEDVVGVDGGSKVDIEPIHELTEPDGSLVIL
jgi:hypothetical protein